MTNSRLNSMCRKCIRKEIAEVPEEREKMYGLLQGEDKYLSLPMVDRAETILYIKKNLYRYRANDSSISHNFNLKKYKNIELVRAKSDYYFKLWNLDDALYKQINIGRIRVATLCVSSIASRVIKKSALMEEFNTAVEYISNDLVFLDALNKQKKDVNLYYKAFSYLIVKKHKRTLLLFTRLANICRFILRRY